jgi:hypothetical protein
MNADTHSQVMAEGIKQEKIRRAMLAGPPAHLRFTLGRERIPAW